MSDQEMQDLRRKAAIGDTEAGEQLERLKARMGASRVDRVRAFIGRRVYIEGARMNYIGILEAVTSDAQAAPAELWFSALIRVGEWNANGPRAQYCQEMPTEEGLYQCIPWNAIDNFGLLPNHWPHTISDMS
jgi:hypothetical protein